MRIQCLYLRYHAEQGYLQAMSVPCPWPVEPPPLPASLYEMLLLTTDSTPLMFARKALRIVNTNYVAALGTGPSFFFAVYKKSYAELLYFIKIVNHAHTILGSIALI